MSSKYGVQYNVNKESIKSQPNLLQLLQQSEENRKNRSKNSYRYPDTLKYFGIYSYISGGKWQYEVNSENLALPSVSTITKYITKYKPNFIEGECRVTQLVSYLESYDVPKTVWLAEDATGIVPKLEYDSSTNQIIGLSLPINENTGLPMSYSYLARTENEIKSHLTKKNMAKLVYVVLAQPLSERCPPFPLMIFGTDNTFTTKHVLCRWEYIINELKIHGVRVLGIATDADTRMLSAMKYRTKLGKRNEFNEMTHSDHSLFKEEYFNIEPSDVS